MNLYLVERTDDIGYDEYENFVVACKTEKDARYTAPKVLGGYYNWDGKKWKGAGYFHSWTKDPDNYVKVTLIGTTEIYTVKTIINAPFNAG